MVFAITIIVIIRKDAKAVNKRPEQTHQVKVIEKRKSEQISLNKRVSNCDYIVAFSFSDGSVKELQVGNSVKSNSVIYDSIHEGDTGTLTFKERENIEERYHVNDKHLYWMGRLFISFEKDIL